jgi:hypothetical protein
MARDAKTDGERDGDNIGKQSETTQASHKYSAEEN